MNLARFDPVTPNLDLIVDPTQELELSVVSVARAVSAAVEATVTERVGNEALGGQLGSV